MSISIFNFILISSPNKQFLYLIFFLGGEACYKNMFKVPFSYTLFIFLIKMISLETLILLDIDNSRTPLKNFLQIQTWDEI